MILDEAQCKVVYYLDAKGTAPAGGYRNEYIHKRILMEDGMLVRQFEAFMDSQLRVTWKGKAQKPQDVKGESD